MNSRAFFVPCHAHTPNLVVNDAAKSSPEATKFFFLLIQVLIVVGLLKKTFLNSN